MAVKIFDLSAIRPPGGLPGGALVCNSLFFSGPPNVALTPQAMAPSGGLPPYGFSAVGLPVGISIDPLTGIISGTPVASGNTTATVTVSDSGAQIIMVPVFFDIAIDMFCDSLFFSGPPNVALVPQSLTPSGGIAPYGFVGAGLPAGVIVGALTGTISGTPTATGNTTATITITDSAGESIMVPVFFDIALTADATSFNDTLVAPDQPFLTGDAYNGIVMPLGTSGSVDIVAAKVNRVAAGLAMAGGGGGSAVTNFVAVPRGLSFLNVDGKQQFAEAVFVSDTSAGALCIDAGVAVFAQSNKSLWYGLRKNPQGATTANVGLMRTRPGFDTLLSALHAIVANDVFRLEVVPSGGGTNTLKILINGIVVETIVDNTGFISQSGLPGIDIKTLFLGAQVLTIKNFSCGLLP